MQSKYTREILEPIVKDSFSVSEVVRKLGLKPAGGNHRHISQAIKDSGIDTTHFKGVKHNKGKTIGPRRSINDYLSNKAKINSHTLRKRLVREGIFDHKCQKCGLSKWLEDPIPLELHHIDGNHYNNNLSNLKILCPNCHSKTHNPKLKQPKKVKRYCIDCKNECSLRSVRCKDCDIKLRQDSSPNRPDKETLLQDFKELKTYVAVGKKYNVSDNAVRKWLKYYNIQK